MIRKWENLFLAIFAVCLIGGCESGGGGGKASATPVGSASAGSAVPGDVPEASMWMDRPDLPFDTISDLINQTYIQMSDTAAADGGAWEVKQEKHIASCMKKKGFEYYPNVIEPSETEGESMFRVGDRKLWIPWLPDDLKEVERYGYGYYVPDGSKAVEVPTVAPEEKDPNQEYVDSLSAAAQKEYQIAMVGAERAEYEQQSYPDSVTAPDWGGCRGEATERYPDSWMRTVEESPLTAYEDLLEQMGEEAGNPYGLSFSKRLELDTLDTKWRECFQKDFPTLVPEKPTDGPSLVAGAVPLPSESDGPTGAWDLAMYTNQDGKYWEGEVNDIPTEYISLTGTPREVAIAVADYKCRQETDYVKRHLAILNEAEAEFVTAHKAELDKLEAALESYTGGL
jgi:hypothetical protein